MSSIQNNTKRKKKPIGFGLGIRKSKQEKTLEVFFPFINFGTSQNTATLFKKVVDYKRNENGFIRVKKKQLQEVYNRLEKANKKAHNIDLSLIYQLLKKKKSKKNQYAKIDIIAFFLFDENTDVASPEEGYFKVQCLSQLLVKPHEIGVGGIFGKMHNIAWTNQGPILPEDLAEERLKATLKGKELVVSHVDKFPYMVNFHVPKGVRIVSGAKVRLGAHLSPGTTVMPAGFVNFNAGTLGDAMVEGRISAGVIVGDKSDIGGGASIMGTLSGGNKNVISIGERCLLGANAGTGISLGKGCTIAAGVYITAGSKISLYNESKQPVNIKGDIVKEGENVVKGIELNGKEYMLIIQDSQTGKITCRPNQKVIELNKSLHSKD